MLPMRLLPLTFSLFCSVLLLQAASDRNSANANRQSKQMADGKRWIMKNLDVEVLPSYCYEDQKLNCHRYGRLYTWESAQRACRTLGKDWRLPTDAEWRQLSKDYGGVSSDSDDRGKSAYRTLLSGGDSGFDALLGGWRSKDGQYGRLEAHGFYWTASEIDATNAWFYNFGKGGLALHRQDGGDKNSAFSVRCVRD